MAKISALELRQRLFSALVLGPVALIAIYFNTHYYNALILVLGALGAREWLRMNQTTPSKLTQIITFSSIVGIILIGIIWPVVYGALAGIILMLVVFIVAARKDPAMAGWIALGIPYLAGSCLALLYLRNVPEVGMGLTYFLVLTVWATDIGAFIAGRLIGGAKLAPAISPSKTWAGLAGGVVFAMVTGYAVAHGFAVQNIVMALALAAVFAVVSQFGDLFESYVKRRAEVKDSGGLIPGHGGLLDRIDGLVFAAAFFVLFQVMIGTELAWW